MINNWKLSPLGIDKIKNISGRYTGLLTDEVFYTPGANDGVQMNIATASLPNYEKLLNGPKSKINYHLSGYDIDLNDSLIRLGGESVERAAGVFSHVYLQNRVINAEYAEFNEKNIVNINYLFPYTNKQLTLLHRLSSNFLSKNPTKNLRQNWIKTYSLFNPEKVIYVPENIFFFGPKSKSRFYLSVSTGTAAHINWEKALLNSLIEYIQIDAFMFSWYANKKYLGCELSNIKEKAIKERIYKLFGNYKDEYKCMIIDISEYAQIPIFVYGVFLISKNGKNVPAISFGLQGGIKRDETILRAFCESLADLKMSESNYIRKMNFSKIDTDKILDFDKNVEYFANPENYIKNVKYLLSRIKSVNKLGTKENYVKNLSEILDRLREIAPQSPFLDITPPYVNGYRVARVFIPEFLAMTFPSFPQLNHPRLRKYINEKYYIHPMP